MEVKVAVSAGELIDKWTILSIKEKMIGDPHKLKNIVHEKRILESVMKEHFKDSPQLEGMIQELQTVNETLWHVEDKLRERERQKDFGSEFVEEARAVYFTNDRRSEIKKKINSYLGSAIVEEKSYKPY